MGNRLFLQAVRQFELEKNSTPERRFGHVVLCGARRRCHHIQDLVPGVIRQSVSTSLYYCQYDRALRVAHLAHGQTGWPGPVLC